MLFNNVCVRVIYFHTLLLEVSVAQAVANSATSTQVQGHQLMLLTCHPEVAVISFCRAIITAAIPGATTTLLIQHFLLL